MGLAPHTTCKKCGTPALEGRHALVIYFKDAQTRDTLAPIIEIEMPYATIWTPPNKQEPPE